MTDIGIRTTSITDASENIKVINNADILKEKGLIERIGSDRKGYWKLLK